MPLAPIAPTPQLYTAATLIRLVSADLGARGVHCVFELGRWSPETHRGEPRCLVSLGDGTAGEPAGHYQPGAHWAVPGGRVAAPLLDEAQTYTLQVHAPASPGSDRSAEEAQAATDQLRRQIMAAIRRVHASPLRQPIRTRWPEKMPDYPAFVYGSIAELTLVVASPILGDALNVETVNEVQATSVFVDSDGTETPAGDPVTVTE